MKLYWLNSYGGYLLVSPRAIERPERSALGNVVAGSYVDELIDRLYACFFNDLRHLRDEYERFYVADYGELADFLYWRYNVPSKILTAITDDLKQGAHVAHGNTGAGGDTSLDSLFLYSEGVKLLKQIFVLEEGEESEDPDGLRDE